jgi:hypothetical protein
MISESQIQTALLTVQYSTRSSYLLDWQDAFRSSPLFAVTCFNLFSRNQRRAARRAIERAELVIALHACSADTLDFITPLVGALEARRGRLLILATNEYNLPWARIAEKLAFLRMVKADWVGTQLPLEAGCWLYEGTGARVLSVPHALNEKTFRREKADGARTIDIGGRSARYPVFLGDDERNRVYDAFSRVGPQAGLSVDIDNESRFDRGGWATFLNDCRGTIGTEAGSWYLERDDRTALEIRQYIRAKGGVATIRADGMFHAACRHLPFSLKEWLKTLVKWSPVLHEAMHHDAVSFEEIRMRFFDDRPRCPVYSKCVSSRHFDAAGTGTCQILIRGRYNGILQADEHYIALDPDLCNMSNVIERFRDPTERARVADSAQDLILGRHTYRHRLAALHEMVSLT